MHKISSIHRGILTPAPVFATQEDTHNVCPKFHSNLGRWLQSKRSEGQKTPCTVTMPPLRNKATKSVWQVESWPSQKVDFLLLTQGHFRGGLDLKSPRSNTRIPSLAKNPTLPRADGPKPSGTPTWRSPSCQPPSTRKVNLFGKTRKPGDSGSRSKGNASPTRNSPGLHEPTGFPSRVVMDSCASPPTRREKGSNKNFHFTSASNRRHLTQPIYMLNMIDIASWCNHRPFASKLQPINFISWCSQP